MDIAVHSLPHVEDKNVSLTQEISNEQCSEVVIGTESKVLAKKLSHKQWRRHLKKMRRQETRRHMAREREREEEEEKRRNQEDEYYKIPPLPKNTVFDTPKTKSIVQSKVEAKRKEEDERAEEAKRAREHGDWIQREKDAMEEIKIKQEEDQEKIRIKEEAEQKIRSEWEAKEQVEKDEREKKQELLNSELDNLEKQQEDNPHNQQQQDTKVSNPESKFTQHNNYRGGGLNNHHQNNQNEQGGGGGGANYHHYNNPPTNWQPTGEFFLPEQDPRNCKFYIKTGACRFGQRCSRTHLKYGNSPTILIQNFFSDARLAMPMLNEKGNDAGLEYDEVEMIHDFEKFYDDVIGEFRAAGTVVMFKCCQNYVNHLRGNVYVQYSKVAEAKEAIRMFNGRYYAGRMLTVEQSPVTNWKSSICGLFDKRLCPRGKACNFLHVFRNPGNAYSVPNRTDFDPERAFRSGGYDPRFVNPKHPVFQYYSQRDAYGYRSSDMKKNKSIGYGRNTWDSLHTRSRSRSRDRDRRRHRSRSRGRSRSRSRSRDSRSSRSRSRSHSRSRRRKRSRSRTRSRSRSRSHDRSKRRKHSRSSSKSSRSSRRRSSRNDSEASNTTTDWSDLSDDPIT